MKNRRKNSLLLLAICAIICACGDGKQKGKYQEMHDSFADVGQYNIPKQKYGKNYWVLIQDNQASSLEYNLLNESLVGLMALAVNEGESQTMVWMQSDKTAYVLAESKLPMEKKGEVTGWDFLAKDEAKAAIKGYILYDTKNQESVNVASVAAHVYKGVMVDVSNVKKIEALGYQKLYDASQKKLADSWKEFKDKCNNNGLVLMPTLTSNQRSTAIAWKLMVVNLNQQIAKPELGSNKELIEEILLWLNPLSPVFGWEQGQSEDKFVSLVSKSGNFMVPYDWAINTPLMSAEYEKRQSGLATVLDPKTIQFGDAEHYMAFYMSDGDNVQWMINAFDTPAYYASAYAEETRMTFGYPFANLSMISPAQNDFLLNKQPKHTSLMESLGGGYYYADNFGEHKDRKVVLDKAAKHIAAHMRQHRNNVLALVCDKAVSDQAKEAYEAYIKNNDELLGIVVIQYTPYAGGAGETMWFENTKGYYVPVVTVRYSIWNYGVGQNGEREGTPAYIASKYNALAQGSEPTFSVTSLHAWSSFTKIDNADDLTGENAEGGKIHGVESALLCQQRLDKKIKVVNVEELLWQLRMKTYPEETKKYLEQFN